MTAQEISLIASGLLAFGLELIPQIKRHWDKLNGVQKQAIIALIVIIVSLAAVWYECRYNASCPADTERAIVDIVLAVFAGIIGSQGAYGISNYAGERLAYRNQEE
jgi:membrane protein DedA with SNARE-associated domain